MYVCELASHLQLRDESVIKRGASNLTSSCVLFAFLDTK